MTKFIVRDELTEKEILIPTFEEVFIFIVRKLLEDSTRIFRVERQKLDGRGFVRKIAIQYYDYNDIYPIIAGGR